MFKKIHSKRNPEDTVYSELRKEFSVYFGAAGSLCSSLLVRFPKFIFGAMILLLSASFVLSITLFRKAPPPVSLVPVTAAHPMDDGFGQILAAGAALKETIRLKKEVDSLTAKKALLASDSATLLSDLDQLRHLHQPLKQLKP
jgi:hypothetical protein